MRSGGSDLIGGKGLPATSLARANEPRAWSLRAFSGSLGALASSSASFPSSLQHQFHVLTTIPAYFKREKGCSFRSSPPLPVTISLSFRCALEESGTPPTLRLGRQRLGGLELLRLLQGFLCHFFSPSHLPLWGDAHLYAISSPFSTFSVSAVSGVESAQPVSQLFIHSLLYSLEY